MRLNVKWYILNINIDQDGTHRLKETAHLKGKYCKRAEVETILDRINDQISDSGDQINHLINDMIEIQANSPDELHDKCANVITQLTELRRHAKKCTRPKKKYEVPSLESIE